MAKVAEGRKAPDFTLQDAGGRRVSLADFKGKDVIVYFYPKDDTPGCTKEACGFRDLLEGPSEGGHRRPRRLRRRRRVAHEVPRTSTGCPSRPVGTGRNGDDCVRGLRREAVYGKPMTGVIRSTVSIGPDGQVRKHWKRVADAAKHPAQVLEAVRGAA